LQISIVWFIFVKNINKAMKQREIKFRVWDAHDSKMIEPDRWGNNLVMDMDGELKWYKEYSYQGGMLDISGTASLVLMQYTGLNDKDGREIYEGDITKDIEGGIGVVEFKATSFRAVDGLGWDNLAYPDECEVIGNIYENPILHSND